MKASELRTKTASDLQTSLEELLKEQFNLRMQRGSGQDVKPSAMHDVKKNIARVKTVINEQAGKAS